jgi:uncharacterized protein (DUF488 family)
MSQKRPLFTAGYAGLDPESFLAKLQKHRVRVVVDVRQNPVSRKKGFSRKSLSAFLERNGVDYLHARSFGVPTKLRNKLKSGEQGLPAYLSEYRKYLETQGFAISELYNLVRRKRGCLICLENCSYECHRSVVAEVVANLNGKDLEIVHL